MYINLTYSCSDEVFSSGSEIADGVEEVEVGAVVGQVASLIRPCRHIQLVSLQNTIQLIGLLPQGRYTLSTCKTAKQA